MANGPKGAIGSFQAAPGANGPAGPNGPKIVNFSPKGVIRPIASGPPAGVAMGIISGGATVSPGPHGYRDPFGDLAWEDPEYTFIQKLKKLAETKDITEIHELVDKSYMDYLVESVIDS